MTYNLKTEYAKQLYSLASNVVPIVFIQDDGMAECSRMDFDDRLQHVEIRYKSVAEEFVDITHELLRVGMQFHDRFPLLTGSVNHTDFNPGIKNLVKQIRTVVDDTYILHRMFTDTGMLPISGVFYDEIRKDIKRGIISIGRSLPVESGPLAAAWRLRLADLSCSVYSKKLTNDQRRFASYFISHFQNKDPVVQELFIYLRQNVVGSRLSNENEFGNALIGLRDKLDLPSWLQLETRQKIDGRWILKR
ncbi:MAG: hypothetical protein R6U13_09210 [Desulfatiglandaceae bacterium]